MLSCWPREMFRISAMVVSGLLFESRSAHRLDEIENPRLKTRIMAYNFTQLSVLNNAPDTLSWNPGMRGW